MKTLIVLLTLALASAPCLAQQVPAASEEDPLLQQATKGEIEGDERLEFWTSIATNSAKVVGIGAFLMALLFISAAVLRWLWNITMPEVFNVNRITYWQCFRLLLMVKIALDGGSSIMSAM